LTVEFSQEDENPTNKKQFENQISNTNVIILGVIAHCINYFIMLSRTPTRIELKADDMAELDQAKPIQQTITTTNTANNSNKPQSSSLPSSMIVPPKKGDVAERIGFRGGQ